MKYLSNLIRYCCCSFVVLTSLWACSSPSGKYSEGTIKYNVTYPKLSKKSFMRSMLPGSMEMDFKSGKYVTRLSAGMGMFKTTYLINIKDKTFAHTIKLITKKSVLHLNENQVDSMLKLKPQYTITFKKDMKVIAGYKCKHALAVNDSDAKDTFSIYYTTAIKIKNPNWGTPFQKIPGVMLEYQMQQKGLCMHFTAEKVSFTKVDEKNFIISKDYQELNSKQMNKKEDDIFSSFSK